MRPAPPPVDELSRRRRCPSTLTPGSGEARAALRSARRVSADWWELFRSAALDEVVRQAIAGNHDARRRRGHAGAGAGGDRPGARARSIRSSTRIGAPSASKTALRGSAATQSSAFNLFSLGPTVELLARRLRRHAAAGRAGRRRSRRASATSSPPPISRSPATSSSQAITIARHALEIADGRGHHRRRPEEPRPRARQVRRRQGRADRRPDRRERSSRTTARCCRRCASSSAPRATRSSVLRRAGSRPSGRRRSSSSTQLTLPGELPVSLPSELVRQRPDILAAEASCTPPARRSASRPRRCIPSITLSGSVGLESLTAGTCSRERARCGTSPRA